MMEGEQQIPQNNLFYIRGLDCPDCAKALERDIAALPQVEQVKLIFSLGKLEVSYGQGQKVDDQVKWQEIVKVIQGHGCELQQPYSSSGQKAGVDSKARAWAFLGEGGAVSAAVSGGLLVLAVIFSLINLEMPIVILTYLSAIIVGGWATFRQGFKSLAKLQFDMNVLMTVAVIGAIIIGEWLEGAIIAFLFSLSNTLENYTMEKTRQSIRELMSLAPQVATIKKNIIKNMGGT